MKFFKIILLSLLFLISYSSTAQKKSRTTKEVNILNKNEVSFNAVYAGFGLYQIKYERFFEKQNVSCGISFGSSLGKYVFTRTFSTSTSSSSFNRSNFFYGVSPSLKFYFNEKPIQGLYLELSSYIYKYKYQYFWSVLHDEIMTRYYKGILPALSIGVKSIVFKRFTIDVSIGTMFRKNKYPSSFLALPIFGVNIGYRF